MAPYPVFEFFPPFADYWTAYLGGFLVASYFLFFRKPRNRG